MICQKIHSSNRLNLTGVLDQVVCQTRLRTMGGSILQSSTYIPLWPQTTRRTSWKLHVVANRGYIPQKLRTSCATSLQLVRNPGFQLVSNLFAYVGCGL